MIIFFPPSLSQTGRNGCSSRITKIIIHEGDIVDSLSFVCESGQQSDIFGSNGGDKAEVNIEHPREYLSGISGTKGFYEGEDAIKSLIFHTNMKTYGPFGGGGGRLPFTLPDEDGVVIGFHGRSGTFLNAIDVYIRPTSSVSKSKLITQPNMGATTDFFSRNPGPFGGSDGRDWDDGVFSGVKKVVVNVNEHVNAIQSVEFEYVSAKHEGGSVTSPKHGGSGLAKQIVINMDDPSEFLMGIAGYYDLIKSIDERNVGMSNSVEMSDDDHDYGYYGDVKSSRDIKAIRSIKFMTNKGVYGPFGKENGTCFASPASSGKIVGFYGRAGDYLSAIGVHMEYI